MRYRLAMVPAQWLTWLRSDVVGVQYFPRQSSAGVALGLALLVSLGPLVFLVDLVARGTFERGDLASGAVAVAIFALVVGWAVRERRRAAGLADGTLRLGAFVGPDALVWREAPDEVWVCSRGELTEVELTAAFHGKGRPSPGEFIVTTRSGGAVFSSASDYAAAAIVDALAAWGTVRVKVDAALGIKPGAASGASGAASGGASSGGASSSSGGASSGGASGGVSSGLGVVSSTDASARFIALCKQHGVEVELVRAGYSEGSSLMSIDHATLYRLSRPLRIRLSLLATVRAGLGPRDEHWLGAEEKQAGGTDPEVVVTALCFSDLTDFQV